MPPERAAVVREALEWQGTPFQHQQCLKHVGCDCLTLVHAVFSRVVPVPAVHLPDYRPDEFLHSGEERYAAGLVQWFDSLGLVTPEPGDVVAFRFGRRQVAHIGILVREDWFLSALYDRGRTELNRLGEAYWRKRWTGTWRLQRWATKPSASV